MFHSLAPYLTDLWGPFRLLGSYLVLIGIGIAGAGLTTWLLFPRLWRLLPVDRGRVHAVKATDAQGKPTGAGSLLMLLVVPWLFLLLPWTPKLWGIVACLLACMLTGYLDDRSRSPWGEYFKGSLDLLIAFLTSLVLCQGRSMGIWLPIVKGDFELPVWLFIVISTLVLWFTINATNCSDGVDGLAGTLTLLSLFYLGAFLYVVIGHSEVADYLLVPHNPQGADGAILVFTIAGGLAGYLWYNAEPSSILMGDAGSRCLGLLVGVAVMMAGNPFLVLVVAPVILANGGTGLFKIVLLRILRRFGVEVRPPNILRQEAGEESGGACPRQHYLIKAVHSIRFPLHDHCRNRLGWSNPQVLLRFVLIQAFLTPLLFVLLVKLR
ncbi:MAG: phospho-N-acetylmuramoyl-pentapeptide-transferase [Candidatus Pacebacteria bacterium]|nr:phospho-N-acetylmuramoyl-pentapeptide-transferase [Candidatus Paceibacterota bacterium]